MIPINIYSQYTADSFDVVDSSRKFSLVVMCRVGGYDYLVFYDGVVGLMLKLNSCVSWSSTTQMNALVRAILI